MRADRILVTGLILAICLSALTPARGEEEQKPAAAVATLPLEELLRLHAERDARAKRAEPRPPLDASIVRLALAGRLLDDAVDVTASFEVAVLARDRWVSVPLLHKTPHTQLAELPDVAHGTFAVQDGVLRFLTRRPGRYRFDLSFLQGATVEGKQRIARIEPGEAAQASLVVAYDTGLFRLMTPGGIVRPEGVELFAEDGRLAVAWEPVPGRVEPKPEPKRKPEATPTVTRAHASCVATLAGQRITRLRYALRFPGRPRLRFGLPAGHRLERAYLNGIPLALEAEGDAVELEVAPLREGEEAGTLELVLRAAQGSFPLSGTLEFELPSVSWPVHELYLDLHLPEVFGYTWRGGSLAEVETSTAADFSHRLPLPGRRLSFHQVLIGATRPNVTLDYTVNLEGHYFHE